MEALTEITAAVKNVPALRFSEFEGEWEESRLGDGVKLVSGQHLGPDDYNTEVNGEPYFTGPSDFTNEEYQVTKWTNSSKHFGKKGDVLITVKGSGVGTMTLLKLPKVAMGRQLMAIKSGNYNSEFVYHFLLTKKNLFVALASGNMIPGLSRQDILTLKLKVPTTPEQEKIASFLSAIDEKIQQLSKKKTLLEKFKKGVMQQIFSQQIRFKDDNGNDFPEWEYKKLGNVGDCYIGLTYSPSDVVEENGVLILRSSNIKNGVLAFDDNVYVNANISEKNFVKENDILICARNGSKSLIGKCALIKKENEGAAFGAFMSIFRSSYNSYLYHIMQTNVFLKQVNQHLGATINQITTQSLKSFSFHFPCLEEQTKIADFLSSIDFKINHTSKQLEQAQQFKKGLLQQLFV